MGADASLQINHPDRNVADRLIERARSEVARLEKIFSLYNEESALCVLNRAGALDHPPPDLVRLLSEADRYFRLTGGAFDVTVQPLWLLYARHFGRADADPLGPQGADLAEALARIGADAIAVDEREIRFRHPGMAITLNGIAQGYITDRVTELLRAEGLDRSLVDMGRFVAWAIIRAAAPGRSVWPIRQRPIGSRRRSPSGIWRSPRRAATGCNSMRRAASITFSTRARARPARAISAFR